MPVPISTKVQFVAQNVAKAMESTYVRREVGTTVTCKAGPTTMSDEVDKPADVAPAAHSADGEPPQQQQQEEEERK